MEKKKIPVAMSGGAVSSVAALLLREAGYAVAGATMLLGVHRLGDEAGRFTNESVADAQSVCGRLGIPHRIFAFADLMEQRGIGQFVRECQNGQTPNPCVDCNRHLKFGALPRHPGRRQGEGCFHTGPGSDYAGAIRRFYTADEVLGGGIIEEVVRV